MGNSLKHLWRGTFFICLVLVSQAQGAKAAPVSLKRAFEAALIKTEPVAIQDTLTNQADEHISQAYGTLLPNISFSANYTRYDASVYDPNVSILPPVVDQSFARFTLTQPVTHGFREFAGLRQVKALLRSQQASTTQAKLTLYNTVATAYFNVLSSEKDLLNLRSLWDLTQKRCNELKSRVRIGRSRKGELLASQAQLATLKAQIEAAEVLLVQARENFKFSTGLDQSTPLAEGDTSLPTPAGSLEHYMTLLEKRPDIVSQREQVEAADAAVTSSKGQHLPSLDLSANYYVVRTRVNGAWDVGATLTVPIFAGGGIQSQVREAVEKRKQNELLLAQTRRNAEKDIRTYYQTLTSSIAQLRSLKEALEITEQNYKVQTKDYSYGLVTNLDVLQALNTFQDTKRLLDKTYYQVKTSWAALQASIGHLP